MEFAPWYFPTAGYLGSIPWPVKRLKNFLYPKELLCNTVLGWKAVET